MKNYVYNFEEYVIENAISTYKSYQQKNYKIAIVEALIKSGTLEPEVQFVLEKVSENKLYEDVWNGNLTDQFINENLNEAKLVDWFKDKYEKAVDVIQDVKQKAGEKLTAAKQEVLKKAQQAVQMFKSFSGWMSKILEAVKTGLQKLWKSVYGFVQKKFNGKESQIVAGAAGKMKKDPDASKNEVKNCGDMIGGGIKFVTGGAIELIGKGMKQAGTEDVKEGEIYGFYDVVLHEAALVCVEKYGIEFIHELNESELILEGGGETVKIPGLSKLVHVMHELPIIKQLGDIEHAAAKVANTGLGKLSYILNKVGAAGGPYKFAILGGIIGLGVEYYAKHKIADALGLGHAHESEESEIDTDLDLTEGDDHGKEKSIKDYLLAAGVSGAILLICIAIPGFGVVFGIMKKVANVVFWYTAIQAALALLDKMLDGKIEKGAKDLGDKIKGMFDKQRDEDSEKAEKLVDKAKEQSEEELKKGGEGLDDEDEKKDKK